MDKIKFFPDNLDVQNKKIMLRLDLNVPLKDKVIKDYTRIDLCLPFIEKLIEKKAKIIIISHLGRPKENKDSSLEESIDYYDLGVRLKNHCDEKLKVAELKIKRLSNKEKLEELI